jgi:hypothetical protein
MTTNDDINEINDIVFEATTVKIKAFAEWRLGIGATDEQLNRELEDLLPDINRWARRQRTLLRMLYRRNDNE